MNHPQQNPSVNASLITPPRTKCKVFQNANPANPPYHAARAYINVSLSRPWYHSFLDDLSGAISPRLPLETGTKFRRDEK
jgi:hypothetical protein